MWEEPETTKPLSRRMIFPGAVGYKGKKARIVREVPEIEKLSPEEVAAKDRKCKEMVAKEGVMPRKSERSTGKEATVTKKWSNSSKNSSWGFSGQGSFASTDIRLRQKAELERKQKAELEKKKRFDVARMRCQTRPTTAGPVWPVENKTVVER